ncbi:CpsD/CapB family tyrosine-protein kinase [Alkalihalobacillus sp. MEB130]|uniref:CpsD/CapB family tyrosine-protein kinase n=1 Tax=Alkalihalobacillus sp. MEB130 TaxID=2976704 RepID=UPI0028DE6B7C|nr:CpsD/CapB family tyrosine-protein kinase [Alkalihalobacillus sp. MEB130]MDT8860318.1 CpsD/CapB family tyrosine-protein kinase [Alkalihalobacillus sp. MEB130]
MSRKGKQTQARQRRNLITESWKNSPISEQYRTIRTNIEFSSIDRDIRTILVTSAGPGEGKSTTAANLAVVMAQNGNSVLLVDADLRKPTAHYTFGTSNMTGLTNVLTKQVGLEEAVQSTKTENLSLLTCGPIPPNPAELLNSRRMGLVLERAQELFDTIILDTPPVMAVADAQILASKCDGTVLVVSSGKTEREEVKKAKEQLLNAKANILGAVLNNKKIESGSYYYYSNN